MESSQTPPPGGGPVEPTPSPTPPPAPAPAAPAADDGKAGAGARIGAVVLALVLAIICAVALIVMADVSDKGVCSELDPTTITGTYECYDFSDSVKPIVLGAGWIGGILAGIAALMALAFTIRGRGGRVLMLTTAAAIAFLVISVAAAQIS